MSQRAWLLSSTCAAALFLTVGTGSAQTDLITVRPGVTLPRGSVVLNTGSRGLQIVNPPSSQLRPGRNRTNIKLAIPPGGYPQFKKNTVGPPFTGYLFETPASLGCVYETGLGGADAGKGCNPNVVTAVPTAGVGAVALVDAFDYPVAEADLAIFDSQMGITGTGAFTVIYGTGSPSSCPAGRTGTKPPADTTGWNIEAALDIEMAHSMAPNAHIYLVEANSSSNTDMFNAEKVAFQCVTAAGGGFVSNSWGFYFEFSGETTYDGIFNDASGSNVTFLASAGDFPGPEYPCTSPYVVCLGGTTISRDQNGNFLSEAVWNDDYSGIGTGGGQSLYEPRPAYQNFMSSIVGNSRGVPDFSADADPETGVWIYNSNEFGGWGGIGGTSVASPLFAALLNRAGYVWGQSYNALVNIYSLGQSGALAPYVTNVTAGLCGPPGYLWYQETGSGYPNAYNPPYDPQYTENASGIPWNFCTGWGSAKNSGNPNWMRAKSTR